MYPWGQLLDLHWFNNIRGLTLKEPGNDLVFVWSGFHPTWQRGLYLRVHVSLQEWEITPVVHIGFHVSICYSIPHVQIVVWKKKIVVLFVKKNAQWCLRLRDIFWTLIVSFGNKRAHTRSPCRWCGYWFGQNVVLQDLKTFYIFVWTSISVTWKESSRVRDFVNMTWYTFKLCPPNITMSYVQFEHAG